MEKALPAADFRDLKVWRQSRDLAVDIGNLCDTKPLCQSRALADQMQRSSVSVPSNIAEGNDRGSNRDTIRFLYIARGSLAELRTQLDIAEGRHKISATVRCSLDSRCAEIGKMLNGLIKARLAREPTKEPRP